MTLVSKNVYIDKLDDIVGKHNNICLRIIKMQPVDVKPKKYIDFNKENNKESPKFKVGDHVRMSKYENIFVKVYVPNWSEEVFVNKNTAPWVFAISDLKGEESAGIFYKIESQKANQKEFRTENQQREKTINYMLNGRVTVVISIVGLIKKT